ncbi:MAG: hypothetical protein JXA03_13715 [Bacteroidales bacterium]|nr:hypothetical protein [Bacteroidales bacterium]
MDRSERKKQRRRRREYFRQEKESVKRDRKRLRHIIRRERWRRIRLFFSRLFIINRTGSGEIKQAKSKKRKGSFTDFLKFRIRERVRQRTEEKERKRKYRPLRERIRKARREKFRKDVIAFFKNPFPGRKLSKNQRFVLREIKRERRQNRKEFIRSMPRRALNSVFTFWSNRFRGIRAAFRVAGMFAGEFREATRVKEVRSTLLVTAVNSTAFFILAFLALHYAGQYITIITASFYDIPAVLYSYRIYWPLYTYSTLYTRAALIVIFGTGPLVSLILGFVFYRIYLLLRARLKYLKVLLVWLVYHSFNLFFGAYIVGVVTRTGFIYTSEWLFLSNVFDVEEIVLLIVSVVILIITGYYGTKHVILASLSNKVIEPKRRVFYFIFQLLIPWLAGNLALILMNMPNNPDELLLLYATSILIIVPGFSNFNAPAFQQIRVTGLPSKVSVRWIYLAAAILAVLTIRIGLGGGIGFG